HYIVYRDTATGYNVYDPGLKMRVADKKDEVCRFLWQHLGVDPGTDLDSLFRRAIGVPQGTFTAIFLDTPAERKKAFDKLLKVEEYRRGAEELLKTARFIDQQAAEVREKIARYEGEIARIDDVEAEHKLFAVRVTELTAELDRVAAEVVEKQASVETLDKAELVLLSARATLDKFQTEQMQLAVALSQKENQAAQGREAAVKTAEVKADSEKHTAAVLQLHELERERVEREKLRDNLSKVETALAAVRADQRYSQEALERALRAHAEMNGLRPAVSEQGRLETELSRMRDLAAQAKALGNQITALDEKIGRLRESFRLNKNQIANALEKTAGADGRETLEKRDEEIVRELASLHAALERDERFQREIQNGLCPILSQKCLNLKEGESLESFVTSQFTELRTRIAVLETEHGQVGVALRTSRESEKFLAQLATLQAREKEIADEGKLLRDEKDALQSQLDALPKIEDDLARTETALKELNNPKGRMELLEAETRIEGELRQKLSNIESNVERLESDRRILVEQLDLYKDLDARWTESAAVRDATANANRIYLANEALANRVDEYEQQLAVAKKDLEAVQSSVAEAKETFEQAEQTYDRRRHRTEREMLVDLQKRQAELSATLDSARRREAELAAELRRLDEVRKSIQAEFKEKERLEKMSELTTFIRDTLKEAAPLVARNYVYHVSAEANVMFREITGNAEHTLKWAEDYGISLEEGGYERPFQSLSGGEQMAAALSVRLALLKQLTDLRIAFFDEPTSNLDLERRENLAMQISQIKHFEQLFVISHDDTFEGYVDNVVTVAKDEPGQGEAMGAQASLLG
ncbi:MAG TPA: SMC family ATPase, partial [Pyrinomonadaceae bacterium]